MSSQTTTDEFPRGKSEERLTPRRVEDKADQIIKRRLKAAKGTCQMTVRWVASTVYTEITGKKPPVPRFLYEIIDRVMVQWGGCIWGKGRAPGGKKHYGVSRNIYAFNLGGR